MLSVTRLLLCIEHGIVLVVSVVHASVGGESENLPVQTCFKFLDQCSLEDEIQPCRYDTFVPYRVTLCTNEIKNMLVPNVLVGLTATVQLPPLPTCEWDCNFDASSELYASFNEVESRVFGVLHGKTNDNCHSTILSLPSHCHET